MTISDAERHRLHTRLDQVLGEEDAAVLISHLPPSGWSDVARHRDLDELEHRITARVESLEARMDARFAAVDARFAAVDARFDVQDAKFEARFAETRELLHRELRRSALLHVTVTGVIVSLVVTITQLATP